jgi:hypothetical protein
LNDAGSGGKELNSWTAAFPTYGCTLQSEFVLEEGLRETISAKTALRITDNHSVEER